MSFSVIATDDAARAGVLRTAHGEVETPAFMPVGTQATVNREYTRALIRDNDEVRTLSEQLARVKVSIVFESGARIGPGKALRVSGMPARSSGRPGCC
jgi:hypothetical protein